VVLAVIDIIIKFLWNNMTDVPFWAAIVGCSGTGKSYINNTILIMVRNMRKTNTTILVGAPSGAAAFNVQESTLHHLLGIGISRPEDNISQKVRDKLQIQVQNLLCLITDKQKHVELKGLSCCRKKHLVHSVQWPK
jgi:hypothetical protein